MIHLVKNIRRFTAIAITLCCLPNLALAQGPELRFGGRIPPEVDEIYSRGLAWLATAQGKDGSWRGGGQSGPGVDGLCVMTFLASGEDPNYGRYSPNIRRGLRAIIAAQDSKTGYISNSMYHHGFAMLALAEAYGAVDESLLWEGAKSSKGKGRSISKALDLAIDLAAKSQKNSKFGGWRYSPDTTDSDTSVTGAVLMGLLACRNAGIEVPDETVDGALEYMRRSTGKTGGVAYSGGFGGGMGGSINLSCIATLVAAVSKQDESWHYEATLKNITKKLEHKETGHPHYFLYYMAQALFQGDYEAWQKWNSATIRRLESTQMDNGSFSNQPYATSMSLLSLALNYRFLPVYER